MPVELTDWKGRSQAEQLPLRNIGQKGKWEGFLDNSAVIIGGLPKYLWGTTASPVTSSEGFLGCVGKIQLNGNTMFLQRQARQIEKGCSGPLVACRKCSNCKLVDNSISLFSRITICGLSKDDIWEIITAISRQLVYFIITRRSRCIFNKCRIISEYTKIRNRTRTSAFYCKNGGLCRQGWDGPKCDCSGTSFIGDTCTKRTFVSSRVLNSSFFRIF